MKPRRSSRRTWGCYRRRPSAHRRQQQALPCRPRPNSTSRRARPRRKKSCRRALSPICPRPALRSRYHRQSLSPWLFRRLRPLPRRWCRRFKVPPRYRRRHISQRRALTPRRSRTTRRRTPRQSRIPMWRIKPRRSPAAATPAAAYRRRAADWPSRRTYVQDAPAPIYYAPQSHSDSDSGHQFPSSAAFATSDERDAPCFTLTSSIVRNLSKVSD